MINLFLTFIFFSVVGNLITALLINKDPSKISWPLSAVTGQIFFIFYTLVRSNLIFSLSIPLTNVEMLSVGAIVSGFSAFIMRKKLISKSIDPFSIHRFFLKSITTLIPFLFATYFLLGKKINLLYTPSTDPDKHAFILKIMLQKGGVFESLTPYSDVVLHYVSGFTVLNFNWAILSGLSPVQIVNCQPYLQYLLLLYAFNILLQKNLKKLSDRFLYSAFLYCLGIYVFNSLFIGTRHTLWGTGRLAHSVLAFWPLLLLLEFHEICTNRKMIVGTIAVVIAALFNPAHLPATALLFISIVSAKIISDSFFGKPFKITTISHKCKLPSLIVTFIFCVSFATYMFSIDPFYKHLFKPKNTITVQTTQIQNGSVSASLSITDVKSPSPAASFSGNLETSSKTPFANLIIALKKIFGIYQNFQVYFILSFLCLQLYLILFIKKHSAIKYGYQLYLYKWVNLVSIWGIFILLHSCYYFVLEKNRNIDDIHNVLLVGYTLAVHRQFLISLYFLLTMLPLSFIFYQMNSAQESKPFLVSQKNKIISIFFAIILLSIMSYSFYKLTFRSVSEYINFMDFQERSHRLAGAIPPESMKLVRWADLNIPPEERIVLSAQVRTDKYESRSVPENGSRAIPLYGKTKTAFFNNLDQQIFNGENYFKYVDQAPDIVWLAQQNCFWIYNDGRLSPIVLSNNWVIRQQAGNEAIWEMKREKVLKNR